MAVFWVGAALFTTGTAGTAGVGTWLVSSVFFSVTVGDAGLAASTPLGVGFVTALLVELGADKQ